MELFTHPPTELTLSLLARLLLAVVVEVRTGAASIAALPEVLVVVVPTLEPVDLLVGLVRLAKVTQVVLVAARLTQMEVPVVVVVPVPQVPMDQVPTVAPVVRVAHLQ